jgi:hypothetical protein
MKGTVEREFGSSGKRLVPAIELTALLFGHRFSLALNGPPFEGRFAQSYDIAETRVLNWNNI